MAAAEGNGGSLDGHDPERHSHNAGDCMAVEGMTGGFIRCHIEGRHITKVVRESSRPSNEVQAVR